MPSNCTGRATGDMAGRHLLPALAESAAAGTLPAGLRVVGAAADTPSGYPCGTA